MCLDTVSRFKGLEAQNVILIVAEKEYPPKNQVQYCAMSRAISQLVVIEVKPSLDPLDINLRSMMGPDENLGGRNQFGANTEPLAFTDGEFIFYA